MNRKYSLSLNLKCLIRIRKNDSKLLLGKCKIIATLHSESILQMGLKKKGTSPLAKWRKGRTNKAVR